MSCFCVVACRSIWLPLPSERYRHKNEFVELGVQNTRRFQLPAEQTRALPLEHSLKWVGKKMSQEVFTFNPCRCNYPCGLLCPRPRGKGCVCLLFCWCRGFVVTGGWVLCCSPSTTLVTVLCVENFEL